MRNAKQFETRNDEADDGIVEFRVDRRARLRPGRLTREGFLVVDGFAARPGVYSYRNPDGSTRRELVEPATLLRTDTLKGKPITLRHPKGRKVTPQNAGDVMAGSVSDVTIDDPTGMMRVELTIIRADAIKAVQNGTVELSPGYGVRLDSTPGVHEKYGAYDARQIERVYNHLAICDTARGGSSLRIRTDAAVEYDEREDSMKLSLAMLALLGLLNVRADSIDEDDPDKAFDKASKNLKTITDKSDGYKARADAADADKPDADAVELERIAYFNDRTKLVGLADHFNVDSFDELGNADLAQKVALAAYPEADKDGSPAYFAALVTTAEKTIKTRNDEADPFGVFGTGFKAKSKDGNRNDADDDTRNDAKYSSPTAAYLKNISENAAGARR